MVLIEAFDHGVVQMDIRIVLVAGRDAVAGDDRAVHQFGRADHRG